jgi:hypothetical protein
MLGLHRKVLLAFSINILASSALSAQIATTAPKPSNVIVPAKWVVFSQFDNTSYLIGTDEIFRTGRGNYSALIVVYDAKYNEDYGLSGFYEMTRIEVNCAQKRSALRQVATYRLDGSVVDGPRALSDDLDYTTPETYGRLEVETACGFATGNPPEISLGYPTISAAISALTVAFPPMRRPSIFNRR